MLTLGIRYLTGCVVAADVTDRRRVEWPPHPGRVFMALAAAHFQTGGDRAERAALEWLEAQPAPQMYAPTHIERPAVTQYVPVNDKPGPSKAPLQSASGLTRARQPRAFARAWLENDTAYLVWPEAESSEYFAALEALCRKVTRVGHTTSLAYVWASRDLPEKPANWVPNDAGAIENLRVMGPGLLGYLERQFKQQEIDEFWELKLAEAQSPGGEERRIARAALREKFQDGPPVRLRPEISLSQGYSPHRNVAEQSAPGTVFDPRLLIFALSRVDGPYRHLDVAATLQLTGRLREALLQHFGTDPPEVLSGHCGNARSERPHIAFLPLPFVGREHAHGGILGVAVAVPRDLELADRQRLLRAVAAIRREDLKLGALGRWKIEPPETHASQMTLRGWLWTAVPAGARQWATVTPYVCDRHPKVKDNATYQQELAYAVSESWQRVRQSGDISVEVAVTPVSAHLGAPAAHQFPRLTRKDGSECRHTHAILIFDRPVVGPLLLGAGRYRGYGLCRPLRGN